MEAAWLSLPNTARGPFPATAGPEGERQWTPGRMHWPMPHLLGQPPREEGVQVLGVQPQEAFEVLPPDVVGFVLLLRELGQVLRLHCVALWGKGGSGRVICWHLLGSLTPSSLPSSPSTLTRVHNPSCPFKSGQCVWAAKGFLGVFGGGGKVCKDTKDTQE